MLHLVLKDKWFQEIASGAKKVEYRKLTSYWISRILKEPLPEKVIFHRGYSKNRKSMTFKISGITVIAATDTIEIHLGDRLT